MRHLFAKLICIVAAITIMEVPTIMLQSYAWVNMLNQRIPTQGVAEAVSTTFDGQHPCEHCLVAEKLQQDKQENSQDLAPELQLSGIKLPPIAQETISAPFPPKAMRLSHRKFDTFPDETHTRSVPSPPPRKA